MAAMASPEAAAAAVCSPGAPGAADRVAVAYDGSDHASFAAKWAAEHLLRPGSKLVLVAVASGAPVSALAPTSISGLDAYVANIKIKDDDKVEALVRMAKELVSTGCVPSDDVQAVIIPTAGNASSGGDDVGQPLITWAQQHGVTQIVVGARGLGQFKKAMMGMVGLGSTSEYVCRHSTLPFTIVPYAAAKEQ